MHPRFKPIHRAMALCLIWATSILAGAAPAMANDGSLDLSFAGRGFQYAPAVPAESGLYYTGYNVAMTPDGGYLLQGQQIDDEFEGPASDALIKFRHDGSLDTAFGNGGWILALATAMPTGIGVASDGRIAVGSSEAVRVLSSTGSLLVTIVPDSPSSVPTYIPAVALWNDRIVVLSRRSLADTFEYRVSQFLLDGQSDPAFNSGAPMTASIVDTDPPWRGLEHLAIRADGTIALLGVMQTPETSRVTTLVVKQDGTFDTAFNANSTANIYFNTCAKAPEMAVAGAWQRDGKLLVVGAMNDWNCVGGDPDSGSHGGVARLAANGTLDASYGNAGIVILEPGGSNPSRSHAHAIQIQQDQRAIVVGNRRESGDDAAPRATVTRLNTNGSVDTSFGTPGQPDSVPGVASYDFSQYAFESPGYTEFRGLVLDANRPVAVGYLNDHYLIARLENDAIFRDGF